MPGTPTITAIRTTKRDPGRASIDVNGKVAATLNHKLLDGLGIGVGDVWTDALAAKVADVVKYDKALRDAMRRLNRRAMSTQQLSRKLAELDHEPAIIQRVCARLTELSVLNDAEYGRALIREINLRKPAGPRLLRAKLSQRGLDRKLIDELLREVEAEPTTDRVADARKLAEAKLRSMSRLDPLVRKRRLWGALARRGFDPDTIEAALDGMTDE
jgi:regulatory protein